MVSFRLTEEEYERLKQMSLDECTRSVSDFARVALCGLPVRQGALAGASAPLAVEKLEGTVRQLTMEVHELRGMLETLLSRSPDHGMEASVREATQ
jgi:hypothetical protein